MLIKIPLSAILNLLLLANPQSKTQIESNQQMSDLSACKISISQYFTFDGLTVAALGLTHIVTHTLPFESDAEAARGRL